MKQQIQDIINRLPKYEESLNKPMIIAISGFGGSGKSTRAQDLQNHLSDSEIISIDDFIINRLQKRSSDWEGFDRERFRVQVLEPAIKRKTISYDEYNWKENKIIGNKKITTQLKYIIVEGCSILHPDLTKYYDFSIWIDCPLDVATQRGLKRHQDWGLKHDYLWLNLWMPNERDFFDKYRPDKLASYVHKESVD